MKLHTKKKVWINWYIKDPIINSSDGQNLNGGALSSRKCFIMASAKLMQNRHECLH